MNATETETMDALTTCNSCDAAPMIEGDPRGYCAACAVEADQAAVVEAEATRDAAGDRLVAFWDAQDTEDEDAAGEALRLAAERAQDRLDDARNLIRAHVRAGRI